MNIVHRSFAGGEIAPSLYARVDTSKYQTGLRTCKNFLIAKHGGAMNRPGTKYITSVEDSSKVSRLVPFVFNDTQTYIIEFADQKIRFIRNSDRVMEAAKTINAATQANPVVVTTSAAHGYSNGDTVYIERPSNGVFTGMVRELSNRTYTVANQTATTFELSGINGTGFTAFTGTAQVSKIYEIASPYLEADLFDLHFVQSADVVTIVHPSYAPRELTRTGHTSWTLTEIAFKPTQAHPTGGSVSGTAGGTTYKYKVTAIDPETGEESLPCIEATQNITGITQANPAVVTITGHGYNQGDNVLIESVTGMTELNNRRFTVGATTANTFELEGEDSTGHTAYSGPSGTAGREEIYSTGLTAPATNDHTITWTEITGVKEYGVYFGLNDIFGFIGVAGGGSFVNDGIEPDTTDTPPRERNPFLVSDDYPATVGYFQQRRIFAGANNSPEKVYLSRIQHHDNFTTSFPVRDDDAITFSLSGSRVNRVRSVLDLGTLVIFTTGSEWSADGDSAGSLTPASINLRQQTYNGSSILQPLVVDKNALYVQERGAIVRDLLQDFEVSGYRGNDLTVFASHLFEDVTLDDWTFQKVPDSIVWIVRSDGVLLGLTYLHDHQILAWHRHTIGTAVESCEAIPNGREDSLYVSVNRTVNSNTVRYIEEMQTRRIDEANPEEMIFMDATYTYDGRNTDTTNNVTITGGTLWDPTETLTLTFDTAVPGIASAELGDQQIHVFDSSGNLYRFTLVTAPAETTTGTVFTGKVDITLPAELQGTGTTTWSRAKKTIYELWHLEGEDVSILADGHVIASPNDSNVTTYTVTSSGTVVLPQAFGTVQVGLPYISDVETLDTEVSGFQSIADRRKTAEEVGLFVESSRGIYAGFEEPTGTDALENLFEYKGRDSESYNDPTDLKTELLKINVAGRWTDGGRIFIRQVDPLPLGLLSIVSSGMIPTGGI
jgi:hypothetical protein